MFSSRTAILHTLIRSVFHPAPGLMDAYINQQGSQLISRTIPRRLKKSSWTRHAGVAAIRSALYNDLLEYTSHEP